MSVLSRVHYIKTCRATYSFTLSGGEQVHKAVNRAGTVSKKEIDNPSTQSLTLNKRVVYVRVVEVAGFEPASKDSATWHLQA